jgi:PAS domain S-box-containing protein
VPYYQANKCWKTIEKHFATIMDLLNDTVIIIDKKGTIIYVNEEYKQQIGTKEGGMPNHGRYGNFFHDKLSETLHQGKTIKKKKYYDKERGHSLTASFLPIKDHDGETIAAVGITSPISRHQPPFEHPHTIKQEKAPKGNTRKDLPPGLNNIIGKSPELIDCLRLSVQVAKSDATVMLRGETGVGKELFARAIHNTSNRHSFPFIAVNCAAIPDNLIESELFGYASGAFTGARTSGKMGKIEMANKGTLFLDEIGDLSLNTQVKLLRFVQERYIEKVGGNEQIPIDVRIITATNRNLEQMLERGDFRTDLYYRLNVIPIHIPPLRERPGDITLLSHHFLDYYGKKYGRNLTFSREAIESLQGHPLPGNVRELKNIIEHAVILCPDDTIRLQQLNLGVVCQQEKLDHASLDLNQAIAKTEKTIIQRALEKAVNNKSKAIKYLGISRGAFYSKIKKYNLI